MRKKRFSLKYAAAFFAIIMTLSCVPANVYAEDVSYSGKLMNGSFEEPKTNNWFKQVDQNSVPYWNTTAAEGKIEFFEKNTFYISNATLTPTEGAQAVELNADEESSLYQIVETEPSSLYEWGIDHGARTASDTMALIIGPEQDVAPSKNVGEGYETADLDAPNPPLRVGKKYGKDQMMQMIAWLKSTGEIQSFTGTNGISNDGQAITIYSKKFAQDGAFENNQDGQPFSMTPSSIYTEKWCIWIMTDSMATSGENPWGHYGMNAEGERDDSEIDLNKKYLYMVPSGQTKSIFSFTSVENALPAGKSQIDPTFGNFLDNVNFQLYHSLTSSTTAHGSAVIGSSTGMSSGAGATSGHTVSVGNSVATYVSDGGTLQVQAIVPEEERSKVSFVGLYYTLQNPAGNGTTTKFISVKNDPGWVQTADDSGNFIYTYFFSNITSAVTIHFVFIKSPLITYDSNGGKDYLCTPSGSNSPTEAGNIYSFKPTVGESIEYIAPYTSHAPEGQNDAWKFMGWKLFDDNGAVDTEAIGENGLLQGTHSIACNYEQSGEEGAAPTQNFVIIGKDETFAEGVQTQDGKSWTTTATELYDDKAIGLSLVAQWRWRQTFVPQTNAGSGYSNSSTGGSVNVTSATDDENYDDAYGEEGAKAYYAGASETIQANAVANEGYYFDGWYDEEGALIGTAPEMTYIELKESVKTYYAHFSLKNTQYFKRQIKVNGVWTTLADTDTSVPALDHASMSEGLGTVVSSTATNNASYGIIGWYDQDGNPVDESMVWNNGKTIRYAVSGEATYYARYAQAVTINFKKQFVQQDGTLALFTNSSYGTVSVEKVDAIPGDLLNSKAYPAVGYSFVGWYDGEGSEAQKVTFLDVSDAKIITPTATSDGVTYYARFAAKQDTKYQVYHYFKDVNGDNKDVLKYSYTYYGTTGELVMPAITQNLAANPGYIYVSGIPSSAEPILASGGKIFKLYYTKTAASLSYNSNAPENASAKGDVSSTTGYVGCEVPVSEDAFSCEGYKFNGWNTKADGTGTNYSAKEAYIMLANDGTGNPNVLYAQWVPESSVVYTVRHIKLDSSEAPLSPEDYTYYGTTGAVVTAKEKQYDGYTFASSYDKNGNKTVTTGTIAGDGSLVLTLYYTPNETTVTYKANGGDGADVVQAGVVNESVKIQAGTIFSRAGYTFNGWKTPAGTSYSANGSYTLTTGEDILLAQWKANTNTQYKVLHYLVSADGTKATLLNDNVENKTGMTAASVSATPLSIEGYSYKSDFSANGMKTIATGKIAGDGSLVLTLYYLPNSISLSYDPNGGTGDRISTSVRVGETVTIAQNTFTRDGYTFSGWNTVQKPAENSGTAYVPGDNITVGVANCTLYAQWTANANTSYKVEHYKVNGEETSASLHSSETLSETTDINVEATATVIKGYTYQANYNKNDMITKASGTVAGDGSLVLKLYYTPDAAFLHYYPNGGSGSEYIVSGHVDQKQSVKENSFTRDGYSFTGWNTKADGTGKAYKTDADFTLTADENVLYAQWSEIEDYNQYALNYDANGGNGAPENETASSKTTITTHDFSVSATAPSRAGYTFAGWKVDTESYAAGDTVTVAAGKTVVLVAQWSENPVQSVVTELTYKGNGGIGADSIVEGNVGEETIVKGSMFSKENYMFTGWNTAEDGTGTTYAIGSSFTLTENEDILFAQWEKLPDPPTPPTTTLTYKANGGAGEDVSVEGAVGEQKTILANMFSREGYLFIGWNTAEDGTGTAYAIDSSFTLTENEDILYAQWEMVPDLQTPIKEIPVTGDSGRIGLLFIIELISGLGITMCTKKIKKN